jgi:hypothetical protein
MTKGNRRVAIWNLERNLERLLRRPCSNDNRRDHYNLSYHPIWAWVRTLRGNLRHGQRQSPVPHLRRGKRQHQSPVPPAGRSTNSHRRRQRRPAIRMPPPRAPPLLLLLPVIGIPTRVILPLPLLHPAIGILTRAVIAA